jgi:hypothetical protein
MRNQTWLVGRTMRSRGIRNIWKREGSTDLQKLHLTVAHHPVADPLSEWRSRQRRCVRHCLPRGIGLVLTDNAECLLAPASRAIITL